MTEAKTSGPRLTPRVQAHFLALWGHLVEAGLPEGVVYDILRDEARHPTLEALAAALKKRQDEEGGLAAILSEDQALPTWARAALTKLEKDGAACPATFLGMADILKAEAEDHYRAAFWRKLALLSRLEITPAACLGELALDARTNKRAGWPEGLLKARSLVSAGTSLPAALAKDRELFRRSERTLLAAAIGESDIDKTLLRLAELARWRSWSRQAPRHQRPAPAEPAPAATEEARPPEVEGDSVQSVKRALSGAFSSVSDLFRNVAEGRRDHELERNPLLTPADRRAIREAQARKVKIQSIPRRDGAPPREAASPSSVSITVRGKGEAPPPGDAAVDESVRKTIGPDWLEEPPLTPSETAAAAPQAPSGAAKTIGFGPASREAPEPVEAADREEKTRPVAKEIVLEELGDRGRETAKTSIERIKAYIVLLQHAPEQKAIAEQTRLEIAGLRRDLDQSRDPDDEPVRRELDELELSFGALGLEERSGTA